MGAKEQGHPYPPTGKEVIVGFLLWMLVTTGYAFWFYSTSPSPDPREIPCWQFSTFEQTGSLLSLVFAAPVLLRQGGNGIAALGFRPAAPSRFSTWVVIVAGAQIALLLLATQASGAVGLSLYAPGSLSTPRALEYMAFPPVFLFVGVLSPLAAEVVFRGLLLGWLLRHLSFWPAAVLQALLFGGLGFSIVRPDIASLFIGAALTIFAVLLALARQRTGSLWTPVTAHMVVGVVTVVLFAAGVFVPMPPPAEVCSP
jgi:membrane protease YdiL (CAAX protease family)